MIRRWRAGEEQVCAGLAMPDQVPAGTCAYPTPRISLVEPKLHVERGTTVG